MSLRSLMGIGEQVCTLKAGCLFGELALLNDQPRAASVKCLVECEFLTICRMDFDTIMKQEMLRAGDDKLRCLLAHVPGLSALPPPKPGSTNAHPSYLFKKAVFPKGHVFFNQGKRAVEDVIMVVAKGYVEMFFAEPPLPEVRQAWGAQPRSPGSPKMGRSFSDSRLQMPKFKPRNASDSRIRLSWNTRPVGTLVAGGVFGSLSNKTPSPCTVVASSSSVEVWQVAGVDLEQMPKSVIAKVQEVMDQSLAFHGLGPPMPTMAW